MCRLSRPLFQSNIRAQCAEFNVPTCGNIAVRQLFRQKAKPFRTASLFSTKVIGRDGLTCLDQCQFVPTPKAGAKELSYSLQVCAPKPSRQNRHVVAQATVKTRPWPARGLLLNELDRTTEIILPMNESWRRLSVMAVCQLRRERHNFFRTPSLFFDRLLDFAV